MVTVMIVMMGGSMGYDISRVKGDNDSRRGGSDVVDVDGKDSAHLHYSHLHAFFPFFLSLSLSLPHSSTSFLGNSSVLRFIIFSCMCFLS